MTNMKSVSRKLFSMKKATKGKKKSYTVEGKQEGKNYVTNPITNTNLVEGHRVGDKFWHKF